MHDTVHPSLEFQFPVHDSDVGNIFLAPLNMTLRLIAAVDAIVEAMVSDGQTRGAVTSNFVNPIEEKNVSVDLNVQLKDLLIAATKDGWSKSDKVEIFAFDDMQDSSAEQLICLAALKAILGQTKTKHTKIWCTFVDF